MTSPTSVDRIKGLASGLGIKAPVNAVATANTTLYGLQTIDGVSLPEGARALLTAQTNPIENGIWSVSSGAWARASDFDGRNDVVNGTLVVVAEGSAPGLAYRVVGTNPITPGTSAIAFYPAINLVDVSALILSLLACDTQAEVAGVLGYVRATGGTFTGAVSFQQDVQVQRNAGIVFEGVTDDAYETTLRPFVGPTGDRFVGFQDATYTLAGIDLAQSFTANQRPNYSSSSAASAGGTFTYDAQVFPQVAVISITLAGAITMAAPANIVEGTAYKIIFKAGDTNARTVTWNSAYKFPSATPTLTSLSATVDGYDVISFIGGPGNTMIYDGGKDIR